MERSTTSSRPRLVLFRGRSDGLPAFIRRHLQEQVDCLGQWFDVRVVEGAVDYRVVVDEHEPAMCLMESGIYAHGREVLHVQHDDGVAKAGFLQADAYCASRATAMADFDRWGVETVFTMSVAMADYTPDLDGRMFTWPNFVDSRLHHDRDLERGTDVLLTGSQASHYPWRRRVTRDLARAGIGMVQTPHFGWFDPAVDERMVEGVAYSELINRARVVPSCGTIASELVRKHLEIPANGAVLVAEPSPALIAAGFVDMDNCVLATAEEALGRIRHLLAHDDERAQIARAGHDLVHARHTQAQRSQIHDWWRLRATSGSQPLHQPGAFDALSLSPSAPRSGAGAPAPAQVVGRDRVLLRSGVAALCRNQADVAEREFHRAHHLHPNLEAFAGLATCRLVQGDGQAAADWAAQGIAYCTDVLGGSPDPVLLALAILGERAGGHDARALGFARSHPAVRLPFLDRARAGVGVHVADDVAPRWGTVVWPWLAPALEQLEPRLMPPQLPPIVLDGGATGDDTSSEMPLLRPWLRRARLRGRARARRVVAPAPDSAVLRAVADVLDADQPELVHVVGSGVLGGLPAGIAQLAATSTECPTLVQVRRDLSVVTWRLGANGVGYRQVALQHPADDLPSRPTSLVVVFDRILAERPALREWLALAGTVIDPTGRTTVPVRQPEPDLVQVGHG